MHLHTAIVLKKVGIFLHGDPGVNGDHAALRGDDKGISGAGVEIGEKKLAEATQVIGAAQHTQNAVGVVPDRHGQHDFIAAVHRALQGIADCAMPCQRLLEIGPLAHMGDSVIAGIAGAIRRDQHRTGEFSALYGGLEQVEIVRSEQRLLPPHMVSQRFERGKLDVQHRAEMVALPLHIGAQGLERVFLNRIADLPEKKTQANGQITEEEDQSRQVADQSAPASVFQNKPSPHNDMCRTFLIRIVNIIS